VDTLNSASDIGHLEVVQLPMRILLNGGPFSLSKYTGAKGLIDSYEVKNVSGV
jgi:hypothetical protein